MKLRYVGSSTLRISNYGDIRTNDIIDREDLVQSLKHRSDFEIIKEIVVKEGVVEPSKIKKGVKHV